MRTLLRFLLSGLLMLGANAHAEMEIPPSPIVKATLVVDAPLVKRGKPVSAAVTFTMPDGWHIYWLNPGDAGLTTSLVWGLSEGLTAGEIEWPVPERIAMQDIVNYGYSRQVTLPVSLMPTRDDVVGEVKVQARWLVCHDICIPEFADLTALLNGDKAAEKIIAEARTKLPQPFDGKATYDAMKSGVNLPITRANPWDSLSAATFFPAEDGLMANNPLGEFKQVGNELILTLPRGNADVFNIWHGVLQLESQGKKTNYAITASNNTPVAASAVTPSPLAGEGRDEGALTENAHSPSPLTQPSPAGGEGSQVAPSFIIALLLAFVGGLVLNIMPCVLPILALKALALAKKSQANKRAAMLQGVSYTSGVVLSFLLIAAAMLALKATGSVIGWGFQLQNPVFVGFLALVMVLVSANLLGLFELPVLFGERATAVDDTKLRGSFLTGVLAVLVATPCTAPFMATAIGATLSFPTAQALLVFASLGFGMAAPFLLISLWPAARRLLPKPGAWMYRFKQILAVPMLATAAWLVFVLVQLMNPVKFAATDTHEMYSAARLTQLRNLSKPVLVDATAAWCLTCKVNERVALKPAEMQQFLKDQNVLIMVADWTNNDAEITKLLASFGRNGVPLYVYYPPHGEPKILPQILTPAIVKDAIDGK